jgi:hypothetical protein
MSVDARVEEALSGPAAVEQLRSLAIALQTEGKSHSSIVQFFDDNRQALRDAGRDADEDAVLEVMDFLVGWCSPHMSLAPKKP